MPSTMYDKKFLNALVLNAPWNCVMFSHQKLRLQFPSAGSCKGGFPAPGPNAVDGEACVVGVEADSGMIDGGFIRAGGHSGTSLAGCKWREGRVLRTPNE